MRMAKILKQLSSIQERLFAAQPPEKSSSGQLYLDTQRRLAVDLDVYALRRCHSDLSPLYVTRLSVSQEELHSSTLPSPSSFLDSLQVIRDRGLGVMQRVRGGHQDIPSRGKPSAVSRSDSFKFQGPAEREDRVIVPPKRRARKKGAAPSMPQLLEDYAAPLDLVNRAKFRQVSRSDASQLVQVDEDYSDVIDSKDYVTPGEDGTRKIYSANAGDAVEDQDGELAEHDLPYCQPYTHTNGVSVWLPGCEDADLYEEVGQQQTAVAGCTRLPDPLYTTYQPTTSTPTTATSVRPKTQLPACSAPSLPHSPAVGRPRGSDSDDVHHLQTAVYENVRRSVWSRAQQVLDRHSSLTRSCEDLRRINHTAASAIYVNAGDPIVQLERLPSAAGRTGASVADAAVLSAAGDEQQQMSRRMYETAFDSSAPPPPPGDEDLLPRLAALPLCSADGGHGSLCSAAAQLRRHRPASVTNHRSKRCPAGSPTSPTVALPPEIHAQVHLSPPATAPLTSKSDRDRRLQFVGLWGSPCGDASPCSSAVQGSDRSQLPAERSGSQRASLSGEQAGTIQHRYECLEVPVSGPQSSQVVLSGHGWHSATGPASTSGSSTLSSLESLRSGDSASDSLQRCQLSAALCGRLASTRVPVLSPISDKSQEAESPAEPTSRWRQQPAAPPRGRYRLHGSDSGISVDSHGETAAPLPFHMPKLRRKAAEHSGAGEAPTRPSLSLRLAGSHADQSAEEAGPLRTSLALGLGCASNTAGHTVDLSLPFQEQRWYHGAITRIEAEKILRGHKEGSYLVRTCESSRPDYSLSLKSARGFMHMKIRQDPGSHKYILGQFSKPFDSIPQMIQHYSLTKLPIRGAEHMSLLHPVSDDQLL